MYLQPIKVLPLKVFLQKIKCPHVHKHCSHKKSPVIEVYSKYSF